MLLYKDLNGAGDARENTALNGLLRVGAEFMVDQDAESETRVAGEFAEMRRRELAEVVFLCAPFELPDDRILLEDGDTEVVSDGENRAGGYTPYKRTRLWDAFLDTQSEAVRGPEQVAALRAPFRLPRYTQLPDRVHDVDVNTQNGRGRAWSLGDGEYLLTVREQMDVSDPRYFMGVIDAGFSIRRTRVSRVDLVKVSAETGKSAQTLLTFETFSGLGFDPGIKALRLVDPTGSEAMFDDDYVYVGRAGHTWGRFTNSGFRMDPSSTYAVAEPAWHPDGFLSLVAVHARASDALHADSSIIKSLTCTRTVKDGEPQTGTITLPAHDFPDNDWSVIEVELLRVSPTALLLRCLLGGVLKPGPRPGATQGGSTFAFYWSADAGASWARLDLDSIGTYLGLLQRPVGMMANGQGKALLLTGGVELADGPDANMIVIHELTAGGPSTIATIDGSVFNAGLDTGVMISGTRRYPKYYPVAFGGGTRVATNDGPKNRLWMQFDPFYISDPGDPTALQEPNTRPQLMTSDDGGVTWIRRFLPQPWPQRVGFVVGSDVGTMLVPVYDARPTRDGYYLNLPVKIHESRDGGATWKKRPWKFTLPAQCFVDGKLIEGTEAYNIDDYRFDFNRGELFPIIALRSARGDVLPMNPGRPWIADARKEAPSA